jgi:hypothetical protein
MHSSIPIPERADRVAKRLMAAGLVLLLPLMVVLSGDHGATWDELPRQAYGERIVRYYKGDIGVDRFPADGSHLYGGLFDVTAVGLQSLLPHDTYRVRHGLNAVFGWIGIAACALVARRVAGPWAGVLAIVFAATAPRQLGHSANNPKDIPFAAFAALTLLALTFIRCRYPYLGARLIVALGLAIGASLAVRPGGLLLLLYAVGAVAVAMVRDWPIRARPLAVTVAALALVAFVATTVPLPFWPWLQAHPYTGLLDAVRGVSHFEWHGTMLFDGRNVSSTNAPWTYVPTWLWYTTPPVVLAGAALSLLRLRRGVAAGLPVLGLWFTVVFPIAYVIARHSTIYDGIRHLLFIMPSLFVLAAIGWWELVAAVGGWRRWVVVGVLTAGVLEPVAFIIRNHPHEVVYFNPLLGGPGAAVGRFELDYWGNCHYDAMRRAVPLARQARTPVLVSGRRWRQMALNAGRLPALHVIAPERQQHHLEVRLVRGPLEGVQALLREEALYRVTTADGAPLCVVTRGPAYPELEARLNR